MPIEVFETQEALDRCLKYWRSKLFLEDWIIRARVARVSEFKLKGACGENLFSYIAKGSDIKIVHPDDYVDPIVRYCAEKILVHELLHCKYNYLQGDPDSYEAVFLDISEHTTLEQMAKTLIMVKYNVPLDYFDNNHDVG